MWQVNLIKTIQENSGFFYKRIFPGQFSLGSVGDVYVINLVFVLASLVGIFLCSVLKSCAYIFRKQRRDVAVCVPTSALESTRCCSSCILIKFPPNPTPSMGKDCPLSRRKLMKDVLCLEWSASGKKVTYEWSVCSSMPGNFLLLYHF